jgi:DNA polymerase I
VTALIFDICFTPRLIVRQVSFGPGSDISQHYSITSSARASSDGEWSDAAVDQAMLVGVISTVFGWPVRVGENPNPRSLRNFPAQANGAECLRVACCLATERGVEVCAPIHDAIMIVGRLDRIEADVATTRTAMAEASRIVLAGFELKTKVKIVRWPDRYMDPRGVEMWDRVCKLTAASEPQQLELRA